MNNNILKKLEKRVDNKIKVKPIFKGGDGEILLKKFLNKQNYLKPKNIFSIIEVNFLKNSPIGYALYKNDSEIVGFLGTIFSERKIEYSICNHCYLHSWIVDENYRTQSYRLIIPILEKKVFISTFSPIKSLEGLYEKLGFNIKNFSSKIIFTLPINYPKQNKVGISEDKSFYENILSDELKKIYEDHLILKNNIIFVYFNDNIKDHILIIVKKRYKKIILPVLEIIYVSNSLKYKKNEKNINYELIKRFKTLIFKENFFGNNSIFSENYFFSKIINKKAYFKNIPEKFNVDFLYSEILS